jgi:Ulp1 family protease
MAMSFFSHKFPCDWGSPVSCITTLEMTKMLMHDTHFYALEPERAFYEFQQDMFNNGDMFINGYIYICNVNSSHWVCLSNLDIFNQFSPSLTFTIYDSLNLNVYDNSINKVLSKFYPDNDIVSVKRVKVIKQINYNDCGLYALAYAWCLLNKISPHNIVLDSINYRENLNNSLFSMISSNNFSDKNYVIPKYALNHEHNIDLSQFVFNLKEYTVL